MLAFVFWLASDVVVFCVMASGFSTVDMFFLGGGGVWGGGRGRGGGGLFLLLAEHHVGPLSFLHSFP